MFGPNRFQPHLEILNAIYSENESEMFVWYNMEHIFIAFNSCTEHIDVDITLNSLIRTKTSPFLRLVFHTLFYFFLHETLLLKSMGKQFNSNVSL